jgi:hypothetical protein
VHYDNAPSPLRAAGRGTGGLLGLISGAGDVLGVLGKENLSIGDVITAAIGTRNVVRNARSITSQGIKQEAYSIANSVFSNAALGQGEVGSVLAGVVRAPSGIVINKPVVTGDSTPTTNRNVGAPVNPPIIGAPLVLPGSPSNPLA